MEVRPLDSTSQVDRDAWLALPFRLYRDTPQWVPPFRGHALAPFDREHTPFYQHSEAVLLGVWDGGELVARMAVLDNARYNAYNHERTAFFSLFESVDDVGTARELFAAAADWAEARGLDRLRGPRGFGALDGVGLLVKGFEHLPAMGIPYHLPYYERLVTSAGLVGDEDLASGRMTRTMVFPERLHEVADRLKARRDLHVPVFHRKRELRALVPAFRELYNSSLGLIPHNMPLTLPEVQALAEELLSIADPRLLKLVFKGDELIGFVFAYPNINRAIQRCRAQLWPLGWAQLLTEQRRTKLVDLNGLGIAEAHQGMGAAAVLLSEVHKTLTSGIFQQAELVQMRLKNDKMAREMAKLDIDWFKTHRVFERQL